MSTSERRHLCDVGTRTPLRRFSLAADGRAGYLAVAGADHEGAVSCQAEASKERV